MSAVQLKKLSEAICRGLDEVQTSTASHNKVLTSLVTLYEKTEKPERFFEAFFPPFSNVLLVYKREPAVERVIAFVARLAVKTAPVDEDDLDESEIDYEDDEKISLFSLLIDKLLSLHKAKDKAVRFRVCQLLAKLFTHAAESGCVVGAKRMDKFQQAMLLRVRDKIPVVRVHAVSALEFLQNWSDPASPVNAVLLELIAKDTSPDVRRCVLNKLAVTDGSLEAVIERTRDTKEAIRYDAFVCLANKCSIRNLSISRRIQLLRDGFKDGSEQVTKGCGLLLHKWSLECADGDLISLLVRLGVESYPEVVELALTKLFENLRIEELVITMSELLASTPEDNAECSITPSKATPTTSNKPREPRPPVSKLLHRDLMTCEVVFYWSRLCHYLHKKGREGEEGVDTLLPTLSEFCEYIRSYVTEVLVKEQPLEREIQCHFVLQQLCSMLAVFDLSDEVGRSRLCQLVSDLLTMPAFPTGLVGSLLELQARLWPQDMHRVEKLAEAIAELRQPSLPGSEGCGSSLPLSEESCVGNLSFLDLQDDPGTLLRCLTITCEMLKGFKIRKLDNPILLTLVHSLLLPCVQNENPYVRDMAVHCLGLASLLDLNIARGHILLFLQVSQVDHEAVQGTALKVVFDLLHVYGFEAFNVTPPTDSQDSKEEEEVKERQEVEPEDRGEEGEEGGSGDDVTRRLLNLMAGFLEGESGLLREVASEGICKLLLSRRILSEKLLAKLLVLWYNPVIQEETHLRSVLGLFLPSFAALDRNSRLSLSEVYLPVLRMILEAPPSSPLSAINTSNLSDFLLELTRPIRPSEESVHDSLAIAVCNEVLSDPTCVADVRAYARTLSLLQLTPSNTGNAADLYTLLEKIRREVTDKTSQRYLNKFESILAKISPPDVTGPEEEQPGVREESVSENRDINATVLNDKTVSVTLNHVKEEKEVPFDSGPVKVVEGTGRKSVRRTANKRVITTTTTAATATPGRRKRGRRKKVVPVSSSDEESENKNIEPEDIAAVPLKSLPPRAVKQQAVSDVLTSSDVLVNGAGLIAHSSGAHSSDSEDSEDSVVGEHSPFVRHIRKTKSTKPVPTLQFSDDEDDTLTAVR